MSNSTTLIQQITAGANADVRVNENFDAASPTMMFGRRASVTTGLTWGYYGGAWPVNGALTAIANGTVTLTNVTNYVGLAQDGTPTVTATTANPLHVPLYTVVAAGGLVTSYTDTRNVAHFIRQAHGIATQALTTANVAITQAQALCDTLVVTGSLTATRDLVVPLIRRRWVVRHTGTTNAVQIIAVSGTGITIAVGKTAIVECDGTNVNRITADV